MVLADADIASLVQTRVYVNRIPKADIEAADTFHPPKMLVLRQAGGFGKRDLLPTDDSTITALCYGESDFEADELRRTVWERFVNLDRETHNDVLIHHINPTGGPIPSVEPDLVWPVIAQSYTVKADVMEA
jgi:hypothetical protein